MPGFPLPRPAAPAPRPPKPFVEPNTPVYGKNALGLRVVNANKPVSSFTHGGVRGTAKKAPTKVVLHPDGRVEIVHHAAPQTAKAPATFPTPTLPAAAPGKQDPHGDRQLNPRPSHPHVARVPAVAGAAPMTVEQQARALLAPVEKSTTAAIDARIKAQQDAINSSTQTLANLMGRYAPESKAAYANAQAGQGAVDAALGQTLAGQGQSGQAELVAKLQAIDADPATAARLNATAGTNATGASGAFAGRGASSLSDLISRSASAQDYGAKLPGVAGEYGLQSTKQAQSQGTVDTANAIAALEARYPDLVQSLKQNAQQQRANDTTRAVAISQLLGKVTPQASKLLGVGAGTPTLSARSAAASNAKADNSQANADRNYQLSVKRLGLSEARLQAQLLKDQKTATTKGKLHGLTPATYQTHAAEALGLARIAHAPTSDGHPPVSWQQFLNGGLSKHVPMWILIEQGKRVYSQPEIRKGLIPGSK